jgi:hypothetical protein
MTDEEIVRKAQHVFGLGKVYGPYNPPSQAVRNNSPLWVWELHKDAHVRIIIEAVLPYLGARRRQQIDNAIERTKENKRDV